MSSSEKEGYQKGSQAIDTKQPLNDHEEGLKEQQTSQSESSDYPSNLSNQDDSRLPSTISGENKKIVHDRMKDIFAKIITDVDEHVLDVGQSQCELDEQLDRLISTLDSIKIDDKLTDEISENSKRIASLKSRLTVIHTILRDASTRCSRTLSACNSVISTRSNSNSSSSIPPSPTTSANRFAT